MAIQDVVKIQEEDIDNYLKTQVNKLGTVNKCIIDITPATKYVSQIILASCLINGLRNIYEFYLSKRINKDNPDETLYHNLSSDDFKYIHISDKAILRTIYNDLTKQKFLNLFAIVISITVLFVSIILAQSILTSIASIATIVSCLWQILQSRH